MLFSCYALFVNLKYFMNAISYPNPNPTAYSLLEHEPKSNIISQIKTLKQIQTLKKQITLLFR